LTVYHAWKGCTVLWWNIWQNFCT